MTYNVKLRIVTPWLGELLPTRDGVRHFNKQGNCLLVDRAAWLEQFNHAAGRLGFVIDISTICPPEHLLMASTHVYRKEFSRVKVESFESFRKGTILCLQIEVKEKQRAPTEAQMQHLFTYIGVHLGLSPWGSKFGYGRFDLLELTR